MTKEKWFSELVTFATILQTAIVIDRIVYDCDNVNKNIIII